MRLVLAMIALLGSSGEALAQLAPWQPMIWAPATVTPPPAATVQDQQLIVLGGVNGIQLVLN